MLLHNLPTRWMVSGSTRAMSSAMDPPAQRERALMSALANPMDGLSAQTTALVAYVILSLRIWCHSFSLLVLERDFPLVVLLRQRYATWKRMATTGHSWIWLV